MYKQLEYTTKHKPKSPIQRKRTHSAERERKRKIGNRYKCLWILLNMRTVVVGLIGEMNDIANATIFMFMFI